AVFPGSAKSEPQKAPEVVNSIGMKLVQIPAGVFQMGAPESEVGARDDERPVHLIKFNNPFLTGMYEGTQEQYDKVKGKKPSLFAESGGGRDKVDGMDTRRFPVEQVSWNDAVEFCKELSELPAEKAAGRAYRLPTEAEWQYACRAGTTTPFYFGNSLG